MPDFTFATATLIRFGAGRAAELSQHSTRLGQRAFVVTGANPDRQSHLLGPSVGTYPLRGEPTFDDARSAVAAAKEARADHIIGIGGGAVLDLAKAVAILAVSDADPLDHAEVIGLGLPLPTEALPLIAVPTTAGTGAEVSANAVLASVERRMKVSLRSPAMLADVALVDPELMLSCPPVVTAQSGMDALTQCLEPLTSRLANPLVDALAVAGLRAGARSLVAAVEHGDDIEARSDMAFCALMGGLCLANAKLGAVHGLAGVLGGVSGFPHGAICAALLRATTAANIAALESREPGNPALRAYAVATQAITGIAETSSLLDWLSELETRLALPALVVSRAERDEVVEGARKSSSMKGNPIDLTRDEMQQILRQSTQEPA
ncbi:MAG: iron-containing alcohol dehydrogenase [Arachnia sp.]